MPTKVDVLVRDIGGGHSEIDYARSTASSTRSSSGTAASRGRSSPATSRPSRGAYGPDQAHDALVVGPPHTLILPNLFLAEMNVMFVEPQAPDRTIAYTTAGVHPRPARR